MNHITDKQWTEMKRKSTLLADEDTNVAQKARLSWLQRNGVTFGGNIGMMSRWTGEQGDKDLRIPLWKKVYFRLFVRKEF